MFIRSHILVIQVITVKLKDKSGFRAIAMFLLLKDLSPYTISPIYTEQNSSSSLLRRVYAAVN